MLVLYIFLYTFVRLCIPTHIYLIHVFFVFQKREHHYMYSVHYTRISVYFVLFLALITQNIFFFFNTTLSTIHTDTLGFNENEYGKRLNESFFYFISVLSQNIVYHIIIFMQAIRWREYHHSLFSFNSYFPKKNKGKTIE